MDDPTRTPLKVASSLSRWGSSSLRGRQAEPVGVLLPASGAGGTLGFKGRTYNGQPVQQFDAWIADRGANQRALWPGKMVLSEDYYSSLIESAVPLDNRALMALKGSALALDIYAWLAHRLHPTSPQF
ncbi:replication protein RepA [Xanthomonas euvesicatoria]|uniref:replication protein RepA n=1 Tax=Xanthomonas euvesicatoria TaxID=456327 RepID=UPI003D2F64BE